jgi:hypothetical protein
MDKRKQGASGSLDDFLTEEDRIDEGEKKIDLPYFQKAQKVLAGEPIINIALFQINQEKEKRKFLAGQSRNPRRIGIGPSMGW